jgi:hypothetical protein
VLLLLLFFFFFLSTTTTTYMHIAKHTKNFKPTSQEMAWKRKSACNWTSKGASTRDGTWGKQAGSEPFG